MQFRIIAVILITVIFGLSGYKIFKKNSRDEKESSLIFGIAACYAPYISINDKGEYEGFDIDVINALAKELNKKIILKDLGSMTSLMMALEQGSVDAIIWGITITNDRLKKFAMVHYQGDKTSSNPLIFWKKIPKDIKNLSDVQKLTVCVEPSSFQSDILRKYQNISIIPTDKVDDALLNIQYGKADAAFLDPVIAIKFKAKFPEIQILNMQLDEDDQLHGIGIALRPNDRILIGQIQQSVNKLKNSGLITKFEKKWQLS